jgi:hypothetical protein
MRALIVSTLMTLGLTGGVAAADNYRGEVHHEVTRDHREAPAYGEHHRDYRARPAPRFERHEERRGYRWVGGEWRWGRGEWTWAPGHYVRSARW